tara:strand:- start:136 stop:897 length:762 start_codon:yes stop_codon:yes gene_type:complete
MEPVSLRSNMLTYYASMVDFSRLLARIYAVALDLPGDFFAAKLKRHSSQLRLLHYPVPHELFQPGQLRCGAHSDLGMTTILRNEEVSGGLEVLTPGGDWLVAPEIPNTFIVNLGDLMMRWSNDRWRSTQHRVAIPETDKWSQSRRLSFGFFVVPEYDAMVECVSNNGSPAKYPPITVHDYRTNRFAAGAGLQHTDKTLSQSMECFSNIAKISVGGSSYRSHFCRKNLENVKTVFARLDLLCLGDSKIYAKGYN